MKPINVVYIEDEMDLCILFKEQFCSEFIHIYTFINPNDYLLKSTNYKPDIIFLDYRLPHLNGDEVAKSLKTDVPIVLITGDVEIKTNFPFKRIIHKPYQESFILDVLQEILDKKNK